MSRERMSSRLARWSSLVSTLALLVLVATALVPDGYLWSAVVGICWIGSVVVTAILVARAAGPSMRDVIAGVEAEPLRATVPARFARRAGAGPRSKGDSGL